MFDALVTGGRRVHPVCTDRSPSFSFVPQMATHRWRHHATYSVLLTLIGLRAAGTHCVAGEALDHAVTPLGAAVRVLQALTAPWAPMSTRRYSVRHVLRGHTALTAPRWRSVRKAGSRPAPAPPSSAAAALAPRERRLPPMASCTLHHASSVLLVLPRGRPGQLLATRAAGSTSRPVVPWHVRSVPLVPTAPARPQS